MNHLMNLFLNETPANLNNPEILLRLYQVYYKCRITQHSETDSQSIVCKTDNNAVHYKCHRTYLAVCYQNPYFIICVCMSTYIYIYTHTHTHTHILL